MSEYNDIMFDMIRMRIERDERIALRDELNREIVDLDIRIRQLKWKAARLDR